MGLTIAQAITASDATVASVMLVTAVFTFLQRSKASTRWGRLFMCGVFWLLGSMGVERAFHLFFYLTPHHPLVEQISPWVIICTSIGIVLGGVMALEAIDRGEARYPKARAVLIVAVVSIAASIWIVPAG